MNFLKTTNLFASPTARTLTTILIGAATLTVPNLAFAAQDGTMNTEILQNSCDTVETIKRWIFSVAYVLGAIGLVVIAVSAFIGRFKFSHLIALGGGLFIVAAADLLIGFATGGETSECGTIAYHGLLSVMPTIS